MGLRVAVGAAPALTGDITVAAGCFNVPATLKMLSQS